MSNKTSKRYNRMNKEKEQINSDKSLFSEENHEWDWCDEFSPWFTLDYQGSGSVNSMDELAQMRLLTLLRLLNLVSAKFITGYRGW